MDAPAHALAWMRAAMACHEEAQRLRNADNPRATDLTSLAFLAESVAQGYSGVNRKSSGAWGWP